jgi:hypothetical protein
MSSSEFEIRRLEDKISGLNKKLEENDRMSKRNDSRKQWELDRLKREFEIRERGYQHKKEAYTKDLRELHQKRDRVQYQIAKEKEEELEEMLKSRGQSSGPSGRNFNHRIH